MRETFVSRHDRQASSLGGFLDLVSLILDRKIDGRIDQVNHLLILDAADDHRAKYEALDQWRDKLASLQTTIVSKIALY